MKTSIKRIGILFLLGLSLQACKNTESDLQTNKNPIVYKPILLSDTTNTASCVYLTTDENGQPATSWVEIDTAGVKYFYFATWDSVQHQFHSKTSIPIKQNASIHEEGMPKIVYKGDGTLMAIFEVSTPKEGSKWGVSDVEYAQSKDSGKTWTTPTSVFKDTASDLSYSFSSICSLSDGEIGVACLGTSEDSTVVGRPVIFTKSNHEGKFGPNIQVENEACQCCRTALGSDEDGVITLAYRDLEPGNIRDIAVSTSMDEGKTFNQPKVFNNDMWSVNGCPHNGPSVKMKDHKTYITWFTGGNETGLHYAALDAKGEKIDEKFLDKEGMFIQLDILPNGTRVTAYNTTYEVNDAVYSKIIVNKITNDGFFEKEVTTEQVEVSYPQLQSLNNKFIIVAWRQDNNKVLYRLVKVDEIKKQAKEANRNNATSVGKLDIGSGQLISRLDPVCGMHLDNRMLGDTILYQNDIYGFCSQHCKEIFMEKPTRFVKLNSMES